MSGQNGIGVPAQRKKHIIQYLNENESILIKEAAELCGTSEATARRDLDELAAAFLVERTHGGAVRHRGTGFERRHSDKIKCQLSEKQRIGKAAASLVMAGDSVFIDSGTTMLFIAQQLSEVPNLSIITNNLDVAYSLPFHSTTEVIVTGGIRRFEYNVLIGTTCEQFIRSLYVDISFLGADAVSPKHGVFNSNFIELGSKLGILQCGKRKVLAADHSKFRNKAITKVCDIDELDTIVTDSGISAEDVELLRERVSDIIIA